MPKGKILEKKKLLESSEFARAVIDPGSVNEEQRSVEILISTETPIRRTDYWSGQQYDEVLLHGEENVDLTRAATAKLRWMHGSGKYGELPLGPLENVRLESKQLRAVARFSEANPDAEMFWRMVLEGTLTEISVGGRKRDVRITERDGDVPLVEVIRWEFKEASLVDIGADPSAGIGRSENSNEGDIMNKLDELRRQLDELKAKNADQADINRKEKELDDEIKRVNEENIDLQRRAGIQAVIDENEGIFDKEDVKRFLGDKKETAETVARAMLAIKREHQEDVGFQRGQQAGEDDIKRAVADSLLVRFGVAVVDPHPDAGNYAGASLLEIARAITGYTGFNREELIERAMSTSDFPVLLGNVANKMLATAFEEEMGTFDAWTTSIDVKDFKQGTAVAMKAGGRLQKVAENGELKNIEFSEEGEVFKLETFGNEFRVTRQMLINDDLGAFTNIIDEFGRMARRTANGLAYDLLQGKGDFASYTMSDGVAIFDASTHKNYDASGAAVSSSTLTAGRTKMRRQTDKKGNKLNIAPKFLLVPPEQETAGRQLLTSEADPASTNSGVANPHRNSMTLIVDSELDAAPWYLAADRRTIKVLYLQGTNRRPVVREKQRDLTGVTYECVFDFGLYAEDYRGLYKNAGA
ncbi:Mu-like prophage major head subunit gpT family protein [Sulfurimonas sp. ST-25]|uniref:phage major capsid protein n=1 Tax=Sulfurimonas sp. ST-25 TaxID=3400151 RepID=UPI003A875218